MAQGTLRRVSRRSSGERPNALFALLQDHLHGVLIDNTEVPIETVSDFYVCERLTACPPENRQALINRLPRDVRALAEADDSAKCHADVLELDLVDFLLNYRSNRVLSVVGNVGVGKTTFLRYVLRTLRAKCDSLRPYVPVFLNCIALGSTRPLHDDLLYELIQAVRTAVSVHEADDVIDDRVVRSLLAEVNPLAEVRRTASQFVEFLLRLKGACRAGCEPVIVFDNVDQLAPETVSDIVALARAVHLRTGLCVITAMRPATHSTQVQLQQGNGAFYCFLLEVTPPDLRAVVRRRLRRALRNVGAVRRLASAKGHQLSAADPEKGLNSLTEKILHPKLQEVFLRDLCNNDVRRALKSFTYFLKYRDLHYHLLFSMPHETGESEQLRGSWFDHFLDGLMIGDRDHYADDREAPISNILAFVHKGRVDYLVLYTCLALLGWADRFVEKLTLLRWLEVFGYDRDIATEALRHLLGRRLVYSPEVEQPKEFARAQSFRLSASGTYYVDHLVQNPQYLFNAVYDVELPHDAYKDFASDSFAARMSSVWELLEAVLAAETSQLERVVGAREGAEVLGAVESAGLLTRRLLAAAEELVERGHRARFDGPRHAAESFGPRLEELSRNVASGEEMIRKELKQRHFVPPLPVARTMVERPVGYSNSVRLEMPRQLAPGQKNRVHVEVELEGMKEVDPIVLYWRASGADQRYEEIVKLTRRRERATYEGQFSVSDVSSIEAFPSSDVTVFAGGDPILVARVGAPNLPRPANTP